MLIAASQEAEVRKKIARLSGWEMTVGWNSQVRIRPREMAGGAGGHQHLVELGSAARAIFERRFLLFPDKERTLGEIKGVGRQQPEGNEDAESVLGSENLRRSGSPAAAAAALINMSLLLSSWRPAPIPLSLHLLRTSPRLSLPLLGRRTESFNYIYSCAPRRTV